MARYLEQQYENPYSQGSFNQSAPRQPKKAVSRGGKAQKKSPYFDALSSPSQSKAVGQIAPESQIAPAGWQGAMGGAQPRRNVPTQSAFDLPGTSDTNLSSRPAVPGGKLRQYTGGEPSYFGNTPTDGPPVPNLDFGMEYTPEQQRRLDAWMQEHHPELSSASGKAAPAPLSFPGASTGQIFEGFRPNPETYSDKSAKGTFLSLAQQSGQMPRTKEEAAQWLNSAIVPGMEKAGFDVMDVQGEKMNVGTTENPQGEWVDVVRAAGGANPALQWLSGGGGAMAGGAPANFAASGDPKADFFAITSGLPPGPDAFENQVIPALMAAYPGRVSLGERNARGFVDGIYIDGQGYDPMNSATATGAAGWQLSPMSAGGHGAATGALGGALAGSPAASQDSPFWKALLAMYQKGQDPTKQQLPGAPAPAPMFY